ncbi:hypothetical protein ACQP0C_34385 [Nocardia sp. CA-129566]
MGTAEGRGHPGVLHLYIPVMEMPTPEAALTVADRLRGFVTDCVVAVGEC